MYTSLLEVNTHKTGPHQKKRLDFKSRPSNLNNIHKFALFCHFKTPVTIKCKRRLRKLQGLHARLCDLRCSLSGQTCDLKDAVLAHDPTPRMRAHTAPKQLKTKSKQSGKEPLTKNKTNKEKTVLYL